LIEGSPTIHCDLEVAQDHDHDQGARVATASRLINAVVAVCDAPPGLLSALELPLITGRG
jgi:4-hydroxy-tetrahydrodipicolinate reductase